jgi:hypothetical protein
MAETALVINFPTYEIANDILVDKLANNEAVEKLASLGVDLKGPWRKIHHLNFWWMAGHGFLVPVNGEGYADRILQQDGGYSSTLLSHLA